MATNRLDLGGYEEQGGGGDLELGGVRGSGGGGEGGSQR